MRASFKWILPLATLLPVLSAPILKQPVALAQNVPHGERQRADGLYKRGIQPVNTNQFQSNLAVTGGIGAQPGKGPASRNLVNAYDTLGQSSFVGLCSGNSINRLIELGINYHNAENFEASLSCLKLALQRVGNGNGISSIDLGRVYFYIGKNYTELTNYSQAQVELSRAFRLFSQSTSRNSIRWQANTLFALSTVASNLGDYSRTVEYLQKALQIYRALGSTYRRSQSATLNNLGLAYMNLGSYEEALQSFQASLQLTLPDETASKATTYGNIARTLTFLGRYREALDIALQVLEFRRQEGDPFRISVTLNDLGNIYAEIGDFEAALEHYQQSVAISRQQGSLHREALTLWRIGLLHNQISETNLAIVFLKKSINVTESFRQQLSNQGLQIADQRLYLASVADSYRLLINLLLDQGRILEAQRVLELLKIEEIREFTRATYTTEGLRYGNVEQQIVSAHDSLMALGAKIYACDPNCDQSLYDEQIALEAYYDDQVETFQATVRENRAVDDEFYDPTSLASDALDIVNAQPGTALIYPFVQGDELWLLWTATGGVVGSIKVETIERAEADLSMAVFRFRELLDQRDAESLKELQQVGQQLYSWLIEPLAQELAANDIQRLVFAQDRTTRYLPMAALHDGEQYLIQRYTVSTVLSAALTDTTDRLGEVDAARTLALGLDRSVAGYSPLPNVFEELHSVVKTDASDPDGIYPGQVFMNDDFTFETLSQQVRRYRILHIATHAAFVPEQDGQSYILSGRGERLNIDQIGSLDTQFSNLHMVVLSACQTALGGEALDGTEIAGVSSYFLGKNKAEAVMATLWRVDDAGTSLLMQRFYQQLARGELTKAEALQQAQLSLLNGDPGQEESNPRGGLVPDDVEASAGVGLRHPYYWAPFILIGNSL